MADKKKLTYWQLRAIRNEEKSHEAANNKIPIITNAYIRAKNYLTGEVQQIYRRYFTNGPYTEAQVEEILNTHVSPTELVTLRALTRNITDSESKKQVTDYLSALAAKGRITRLEELKAKSYIAVKQISSVEVQESTDLYTKVIQQAWNEATAEGVIGAVGKDVKVFEKGYVPQIDKETKQISILNPETGKEVTKVKAVPDKAITSFKELSGKYVKAALNTPFYGRNYSQRIWHNTDKLAERLSELLTAQQMSGMSERDMAKAISEEFGSGMANAKRLIRTEANFFHSTTKVTGWKQRGIEEYELVAVLDKRTSAICRHMDGKVFKVSEAKVGITLDPFHPHCRTTPVVHFANSEYAGARTANNPHTGKQFKIDQDKTYRDWEQIINGERKKQS
ncbi:MAG: minor capsid protein [Liquorilactobacillus nagelii]|uniref:minor capsid protein n=1 Tax=Lactobacillaceae TaxID=33958 RepID=UPI0039EA1784